MKQFTVNKNINHNGKDYPNGSYIDEGCDGFKLLLQAGHLVESEVLQVQEVEKTEKEVVEKKKSKKDS